MKTDEIIKKYLGALENGSYEEAMALFSRHAVINSPLYGKISAKKFYKDLFNDTSRSKLKLLNIFKSSSGAVACHFQYDWILRDGSSTVFQCVDVFRIKNGKIQELTIIYDTAKIRRSFEKMKI